MAANATTSGAGSVSADHRRPHPEPDGEDERDAARFRQARWGADDAGHDDPLEARAAAKGLNCVKLDSEVGIIGNGAGPVMPTLDVVAGRGTRPANFLDIGGGVSAQTMADGLSVILSEPAVKSVFANVFANLFGGITACDAVADGIVQALDSVRPTKAAGGPARRQQRRPRTRDPRCPQPSPGRAGQCHGRRRAPGRPTRQRSPNRGPSACSPSQARSPASWCTS